MKTGLFLALTSIAFCPFGARGQETRLALDGLVAEALRNNPEILAAQKRYEAARQRPAQERSLPDPMLSLGYTASGSPRPVAGLGSEPTSNAGVMLSQEFPFPGKRRLMGEIAGKEADAEFQEYQAVQLQVISRLKQAYHRLHHAYDMIDVLRDNQDVVRRMREITEARYSAGRAEQQDIFKAQTLISLLETRILRLEQDRRTTEAEVNNLLARPPGSPLARPEDVDPRPLAVPLEELLTAAQKHSPELLRSEKLIQKSELSVNLARKEFYPDYTLSAGYFNMGRMPDMYQFRIDFKLPAWSFRKERAGLAESAATLSQSRRQFEADSREVHFRVEQDFQVARTSARLMEMYADTVIPQAELAVESALASYQTGAVDFLNVLTNLTAKFEYEQDFHAAQMDLQLALVRLEETTGLRLAR